MFDVLEKVVFPNMVYNKKERKSKIIRIWSAGCASGEEPYSIIIKLMEVLGKKFDDFIKVFIPF